MLKEIRKKKKLGILFNQVFGGTKIHKMPEFSLGEPMPGPISEGLLQSPYFTQSSGPSLSKIFSSIREKALPEITTQSETTQEDPIQKTIDFIKKEQLIIDRQHSDLRDNKMPLEIRNLIQGGEKKKDPRQLVDEKLTLGQHIKQDAQLSRGDQEPDDTDWSRMFGIDALLWANQELLPLNEKHPWAIHLLKAMGSVVGAGALGYAVWKGSEMAADWMFQQTTNPKPEVPKSLSLVLNN